MTTTTWAIELGIEPKYEAALTASAKKAGYEVLHPVALPFGGGFLQDQEGEEPFYTDPEEMREIIYHGSIQGCKTLKARYVENDCGWWKTYFDSKKYECSYYYPRLKNLILNHEHFFMPWGCFTESRELIGELFPEWRNADGADPVFVRPSSGEKHFTGMTVFPGNTRELWAKDMKFMNFYEMLKPETMVVVAPPQNIVKEWRFFVSDGEVVTGSLYKLGVDLNQRPADEYELKMAADFAAAASKTYNPDKVWVMDICETKSGSKHILEVGAASCSGLYECDTDKLVEAMS